MLCYWLQLGRIDIEQGEGLSLDWGWGGNKGKAVNVVEGRHIPLTPRRKYLLGATCYWLQLGRIDSEQVEGGAWIRVGVATSVKL